MSFTPEQAAALDLAAGLLVQVLHLKDRIDEIVTPIAAALMIRIQDARTREAAQSIEADIQKIPDRFFRAELRVALYTKFPRQEQS